MSNQKDDRKIVNMAEIKPHVFEWLVQDANSVGEKLSKHIGDVLELIYYMGKGAKSTSELAKSQNGNARVIALYQEAQRRQHLKSTVRHLAALYVEHPSENAAEQLQEACDAAEIDYDEVIKVARSDPFSSIIAKTMGQSKIDQCTLWVLDFLRKYGKIESAKFYMAGEKDGFNKRMIQRVKRNLLEDMDTPYIDVERDGNIWWYILKDKDGNEIEATKPETIFDTTSLPPRSIRAFLNTDEEVLITFSSNEDFENFSEITGYGGQNNNIGLFFGK